MVPFRIVFEGAPSVVGTVGQDGQRSCPFSLTASASGNFPQPTGYWTSADVSYYDLATGGRIGTTEWSTSRVRSFWGVGEIGNGDHVQSSTWDVSPSELSGGAEDHDGSSFRVSVTFNYHFGSYYNMTGSKNYHFDCT